MRLQVLVLMGLGLGLAACDHSTEEPLAPASSTVVKDSVPAVARDTTPKDTVTVLFSRRTPVVDSVQLTFSSLGAPTRSWKLLSNDSTARFPLDAGKGRGWALKVEGRKKGRLWWTIDPVRVVPDSSKRVVLDSALKRLVVADTSIPVTPVVVDTNLYVPIAQLTGDGLPVAGKERGVFLRYDAGKLVFRITSDGDVQGESYDRVFNARIAVKNVSLTGLGTASLDDAAVGSKFDSDSVSSLVVTSAIGGGLSAAQANMFSRFRLKTFSVVASQCTVEVDISLRSGVIPLGTPAWVMPAIPDEATKGLLFLGNGRTHPSRTHFRIVIP